MLHLLRRSVHRILYALWLGLERHQLAVVGSKIVLRALQVIEHLRDANTTDQWGETLHALWQQTGRGAPIRITQANLSLGEVLLRDGFE